MSEAGFYRIDPFYHQMQGPFGSISWALLNFGQQYNQYPCFGWTWQNSGEYGAGYYHTDGSYKTGVPPLQSIHCELTSEHPEQTANWWVWYNTEAEAYIANGLPVPPPQWQPDTAYAVDDLVRHDEMQYRCIQAGTSASWSSWWDQSEYVPDGEAAWAYIA
jgi:hypothetical protein